MEVIYIMLKADGIFILLTVHYYYFFYYVADIYYSFNIY